MLVTSVVLRPKRGAIAATILERAAALDTPSIGVIYATLTDDPGSARDTLDGFVGYVMTEAASASASVDAGAIRNAAVVEETNAGAAPGAVVIDSSGGIAAPMAEPAAADNVQDATITAALKVAMLDGAFVKATATSTLLGSEIIDSGPIAPFD